MTDRKARIAALAAKAGRSANDDVSHDESEPKRSKVISEKKSALEIALDDQSLSKDALPSTTGMLAPKKVNWDLKRDIQEKVEKLDRHTQRAIIQLLRERLEQEAEQVVHDGIDLDWVYLCSMESTSFSSSFRGLNNRDDDDVHAWQVKITSNVATTPITKFNTIVYKL